MMPPDLTTSLFADDDTTSFITLLVARGVSSSSMNNSAPPSEGFTLAILTAGFSAIVWFFISEFVFLKEKTKTMAEAMREKGKLGKKDFTW